MTKQDLFAFLDKAPAMTIYDGHLKIHAESTDTWHNDIQIKIVPFTAEKIILKIFL